MTAESPILPLFLTALSLGAYVGLSSYLAAKWTQSRLLPNTWLPTGVAEDRSIWRVLEGGIAVFTVLITQLAMVGLAFDAQEQMATRIFAGAELIFALVWTGYIAGVFTGLLRGRAR